VSQITKSAQICPILSPVLMGIGISPGTDNTGCADIAPTASKAANLWLAALLARPNVQLRNAKIAGRVR
jgi:hypothetical protein